MNWPWTHNPARRDEASRIARSQRAGDEIDERFEEPIAVWQIEHGAATMDMTPPQRRRWLLFIRAVDNGVWSTELAFARWAVEHGRLHDGGDARCAGNEHGSGF